MKLPRPDAVLRDAHLAAALFGLGTLGLLLGAGLGLNTWPAQQLAQSAAQVNGKDLFLAFHGYALVIAAMFWGSRPPLRLQQAVFVAWVGLTLVLGHALRDSLPIGWFDATLFPAPMFLATTLAIPCLLALAWRVCQSPDRAADPALERRLRWLFVLGLLFMMVPQPGLNLTANLHPHTFDLYALHWDRAAGLVFTPSLIRAVDAVPLLPQLVSMAYGFTPLGFLAVALLHLRGRPAHVASALLVWVGLTSCALLAYHLFPITGPKYVFGSDHYAAALAAGTPQPLDLVGVPPYPRNGMPSMHFGWMLAASLLWWQSGTRAWSRAVLIVMTTLTAVATLYSGEHYVADLIVAVPFVLAGMALCTTGVPWSGTPRWRVVALGFSTWLVWVLLLRWQIERFIEQPAWCWVLMAATAAAVAMQVRWMRRFAAAAAAPAAHVAVAAEVAPALKSLQLRFGALFFFSGIAALVYQVLFAKELALVFGSTATATFTVLATFLGGMAIGSLIGGSLAHRVARPTVVYAFIEIGIALYCVVTPALFGGVQTLYVALAAGMPPDAGSLLVLRVALGAAALLLPTVLMGTTLPLLAQALEPIGGRMGPRVAWLYFANTAGAALGALLTAYFVIPALGAHRTTLMAAVLNLMVALAALELAKRLPSLSPASGTTGTATETAADSRPLPAAARALAFTALGLGGMMSLGLEVVYVHMLSIVAGNSVYAFGLMVATFLIGLSLGGEAARRWLLRPGADPVAALAVALLGLCITVALGAGLWNGIPGYFASFANYPAARSFGAREAIRGLVCAAVMVPPTLFIGASYAFAIDVATSSQRRAKALQLGTAAAVNTAGNILGVLLFGFVLLPRIGGLAASQWIAIGALALGLAALALTVRAGRPRLALLAVPALAAVLVGQRWTLDYDSLSTGANVYFYPQHWGKVIAHGESIDGGLTTVTASESPQGPVHTLLTNGKFQGNDATQGEMQAQIGFAFAPLLHTPARDRALVIGYGTGVTSRVFHEAGFRQLDIAELSRDLVQLADSHFAGVNQRVSVQPGVDLHVTDGRNFLLLSPQRYDVISIEITSIWFAGAASLYNQEFYRLAKSRMQNGGVLQQWMQLHRLAPTDILQIVATLRSEFRHVSLYVMGSQAILVATDDDTRASPRPDAIAALETAPRLDELRRIAGRSPQAMSADRLLDARGVDRFIHEAGVDPRIWISTDDNLRLEYSTPRANVNDAKQSFAANLALLKRFAVDADIQP